MAAFKYRGAMKTIVRFIHFPAFGVWVVLGSPRTRRVFRCHGVFLSMRPGFGPGFCLKFGVVVVKYSALGGRRPHSVDLVGHFPVSL